MTRSARIFSVTRWGILILLIGLLTGAIVVIFPPMVSIGVVALVGLVLLWALPEIRVVPDGLLRKVFFTMVFVQLCIPAYYAIDTRILPWISARRFFSLAVIVLFGLVIAGSKSARQKISETIRSDRLLAFCAIGFLGIMFLSILTSSYLRAATSGFFDALLNWFIPLFACVLVVRSEKDAKLLAKLIVIAGILVSIAGIVEFFLQRRYYFDIFPTSMLASMMADNPALAIMVNMSMFRNGLYRAASIFSVPLSFGEFMAMVAPIAAFFVFHGENWTQRTLGFVGIVLAVFGIIVSGARGAYIAILVAMPLMMFLWTIRYTRLNRHSLVGAIMFALFAIGMAGVIGILAFSTRLRNYVLGGGDTAASTEARFIQWDSATPHILSNPVTGHGSGSSGDLIGFAAETGMPSVDSYIITLLVEHGIPGFLLFFGIVVVGIWIGLRIYLTESDERTALAGSLACSLVAFGIYRTALSQRESHTLFFLIVGLVFAIGKLAYDRRLEKESVRAFSPLGRDSARMTRQPASIGHH